VGVRLETLTPGHGVFATGIADQASSPVASKGTSVPTASWRWPMGAGALPCQVWKIG